MRADSERSRVKESGPWGPILMNRMIYERTDIRSKGNEFRGAVMSMISLRSIIACIAKHTAYMAIKSTME